MGVSSILALTLFTIAEGTQNQESIKNEIVAETRQFNAEKTIELSEKKEGILDQETEINERLEELSKNRHVDRQSWFEGRRTQQAFMAAKGQRIKDLEDSYAALMIEPDTSKLRILQHHIQSTFSSDAFSKSYLSLVIVFLILLVEALPSIFRLLLEDGKYMKEYRRLNRLALEVDDQEARMDEVIVRTRGDRKKLFMKKSLLKELKKQLLSGFNDLEASIQLNDLWNSIENNNPPKKKQRPKQNDKDKQNDKAKQNGKPEVESDDFPNFDYENL